MEVTSVNRMRDTFAQNLRAALYRARLNQKAFAARVEVSAVSVTSWLHGREIPRWEMLARICNELGVQPVELFTDHWDSGAKKSG